MYLKYQMSDMLQNKSSDLHSSLVIPHHVLEENPFTATSLEISRQALLYKWLGVLHVIF